MKKHFTLVKYIIAGTALLAASAAQAVPVDTELVLLVDVSGSVDDQEFTLQRDGYIDAFRSQSVIDAIAAGDIGSIAVSYVYWSGAGQQSLAVNFMQISDLTSGEAFASAIEGGMRPFFGSTGVAAAITFGDGLFDMNGFEGTRTVIDLSGDGQENAGGNPAAARDTFLAGGGSAINAVAIGGGVTLANYFADNVQGGTDSFTTQAATFNDFAGVIENKLVREITGDGGEVPEPTSLALLAIGLLGFGAASRRRVR